MSDDIGMKEDREIPHQLSVLDKDLEVQNATIKSLRKALDVVLNGQESPSEDTTKEPINLTELGGRLRTYSRRLGDNTHELNQILNDLQL